MNHLLITTPFELAKEHDQEETMINLVTDGMKSSYTKQAYRLAFDYFLKGTVKHQDLRQLWDLKKV